MNLKVDKTNVFVDLMMRNAHVGKASKVYFGNHTLSLPCENLTLKQIHDNEVGDVIEIYYDGLLKALIQVDTIIAVLSDERSTEMEVLIKAIKGLNPKKEVKGLKGVKGLKDK